MSLVKFSYGSLPVATFNEVEAIQQVSPSLAFDVVWCRKWLLVLITLIVSIPATAIIFSLSPYYDAQASLLIDIRRASYADQQSAMLSSGATADAILIGTQVDVLRSSLMAETVAERLDLANVPEFQHVLDAPATPLSNLIVRLSTLVGIRQSPQEVLTDRQRQQAVASILLSKVSISTSGKSYLIDIRARTANPDLSASIANTYADSYLDFNRRLKTDSIRRANGLLDEQIAPLQERVSKAENAVERFRQDNGLITNHASEAHAGPTYGATLADQQLAEVNSQLVSVSGEVAQKEADLRAVQSALKLGGVEALPQVVTSPLIQSLRQQEAELSSREASLGETALGNNPVLQSAQAASARVRQRIASEISKIASSLTDDLNSARVRQATLQQRIGQLQNQVAGQSKANVSLVQLQSEAQAARTVYQDYLSRFEQTSAQGALQEPEAELVSPAETPLKKAGPARGQLVLLTMCGTIFVASGLVLLFERGRTGIRNPEKLEAETGLFSLGFVPRVPGGLRRAVGSGQRSIYTEAVSLVNNLLQFGEDRYRARVVLVTSACPQEGKTFLATSLAAGVGQDGGRALLIDCDLRRPSVANALGLPDHEADVTRAGDGGRAVLHQNVLTGLDVVTFRRTTGEPLHLLDSSQIRSLIDDARDRYDLILLDAPPVLAFADALVLSLCADGAIMVVRWGQTSSRVVLSALKALRAYNVRVLGGVVTQVKTRGLTSRDGSHAQIYQNYSNYFG